MSKKEKYLKELSENLKDYEYKNEILNKYEILITEKLSNGEKITAIIKSFGNIEDVIDAEKRIYNNKNKLSSIIEKSKEMVKNTGSFFKNIFKKINIKIKKIRFERKIKNKFDKIKETFKAKKVKKKIKKSKNKVIKEAKKIVPIKKVRSKCSWLLFIFQVILFIILFYVLTLFMAILFAILDGIKFYGLAVLLFSLSTFIILILSFLNKKRHCIEVNSTFYFISFIVVLIMISFGVGYTSYNYFDINYVSDISEKYSYATEKLEYKMPKEKDLHIHFNSWYKNSYLIQIDEELTDSVKVEIKYYEAFYDLFAKRENGNVHISLAFDKRDLISVYLNNLKENKIYNEKEFSRYLVRIYVNEENSKRLIVHN